MAIIIFKKGGIMGFESMDILAPEVSLTVKKHNSFKTRTGAILSIVGFVGIVLYLILLLIDYYKRQVKSIATVSINVDSGMSYNLLSDKRIPVVMVATTSANVQSSDVSKYITVKLDVLKYDAATQTTNRITLDYEPCQNLINSGVTSHFLIDEKLALDRVQSEGYCLNPQGQSIIASGKGYEAGASYATLRILPCSLSSGCVTAAEVKQMYVIVGLMVPTVDVNNYQKPVSYRFQTDYMLSVSLTMGQYYTDRMMQVNIKDSQGFPLKDQVVKTFSTTEKLIFNIYERDGSSTCTTAAISARTCPEYLNWDIISGTTNQTQTRLYTTIGSLVAEVGGMKTAIFFILFWLYFMYNRKERDNHMVRTVYNIRKKPKPFMYYVCCCQKKYKNDDKDDDCDSEGVVYASQEIFAQAKSVIQRNLDMSFMAKDLNILKFIIHFLLTEYQRNLVPIVTLNIDLNREKERLVKLKGADAENIFSAITTAVNPFTKDVDDSFDDADVLGNKKQTDKKQTKGSMKQHQLKEAYDTLMRRFNEEGIQNLTPEQLADMGFKKELCTDLDKKFYSVLGEAPYLPFREELDEELAPNPDASPEKTIITNLIPKTANNSTNKVSPAENSKQEAEMEAADPEENWGVANPDQEESKVKSGTGKVSKDAIKPKKKTSEKKK